jgi:hypothetical protein
MPRGRGGSRQGTPGKAYTNRTDMMMNYNMEAGSPAAGGVDAPSMEAPMIGVSPDDIPSISTPTQRPGEPITTGLGIGPGAGREALTGFDPRAQETARLAQRWGPMMDILSNDPETPDSVRMLARYIKGFG